MSKLVQNGNGDQKVLKIFKRIIAQSKNKVLEALSDKKNGS